MQQRLMKKTAVCVLVFFLVSMGFILAISAGREGEPIEEMEEPALNEAMENELSFERGQADTSYLRVPLPAGCRAQELIIEGRS